MTNTRCELINALIYPLTIATLLSLCIPGLPLNAELGPILYYYFVATNCA